MTDTAAYTRQVHTRAPKASDIEIHVSSLTGENGDSYTDIREFVVSLQQYGRGITFPSRLNDDVEAGLLEIKHAPSEK